MWTVDLRAEAAAGAKAVGPLPALTSAERAAAVDTWRGRMVNESLSSRVFAGLVPQMMAADLPPRWLDRAARAATDELRHGRQCAAVVHALGGDAYAVVPHVSQLPTHDDASPLEAVLRNVLSVSCLSETVAVALIGAERLAVAPAGLTETLSQILADEVQHARFGWELLAEQLPRVDADVRARLDAYLVVAFRHLVAHELAHLPAGAACSDTARDVGVCDGADARALFFDTVRDVIVPRLSALGFAAASAWQQVAPDPGVCVRA